MYVHLYVHVAYKAFGDGSFLRQIRNCVSIFLTYCKTTKVNFSVNNNMNKIKLYALCLRIHVRRFQLNRVAQPVRYPHGVSITTYLYSIHSFKSLR